MRRQWSEVFPPMPTPRKLAACITSEQALVVAGGYAGASLDTVEVMNIDTKQWTTVSSLPQKHSPLSGTLCEDTLYLAGGSRNYQSKCVFTCSIPDLMSSTNTLGSRVKRRLSRSYNIWKEISSPPVQHSTLASFKGDLLSIGGRDNAGDYTADVYRYNSDTNSWDTVSQMKTKRAFSFAVALPEDRLFVAGGYTGNTDTTNSVEILE